MPLKSVTLATLLACTMSLLLGGADKPTTVPADLIYQNDFNDGLADFQIEQEQPAKVEAKGGTLTIDAPAGITVWLKQKLSGPVAIEYDATAISAGGPNDRVSDLNCFWMADDPAHPGALLDQGRTGKFADYDTMTAYYVGYGGNANTTTRFRRYIGQSGNRPLRPEDDLNDEPHLLTANKKKHLKLVADGSKIAFWRDGERVFSFDDPQPYTSGWFGLRTVKSHLAIEQLRIHRP